MDVSIALKLLLAAVLGGMIGIERQIREKPAGLRTNMLICVGATQFMVISTKAAQMLGGDPMRIAAQIVTGIGFLGAGAVLHSHGFVMGLTTAATIWVVAGVGMALGAGMYGVAVAVTILAIVTLYLLSFVETRLVQAKQGLEFRVKVQNIHDGLEAVHRTLHANGLTAGDLSFKKEEEQYRIWFHSTGTRDTTQKVLQELAREPAVLGVETNARNAVPE